MTPKEFESFVEAWNAAHDFLNLVCPIIVTYLGGLTDPEIFPEVRGDAEIYLVEVKRKSVLITREEIASFRNGDGRPIPVDEIQERVLKFASDSKPV